MKSKRIALVIYSLHEGGAEKVTAELSIYFAQSGHDVVVVVFDDHKRLYAHGGQLIDLNLPAAAHGSLFSRFKFLLLRARRLRRLYRQQPFDLMVAVMESAGFASILASRETIVANHCNPAANFSAMEWWLAGRLFPRTRKVVTVSAQGQAIFRTRLGLKNLQTIYNPVARQRIYRAARQTLPADLPGRPYMIAIGRLETVKRFDRLLAAYARSMAKDHLDLILLGSGSLYDSLQQQIRQLGLQARVMMPGHVQNPYPYIQRARFMVLSSDHEGFPVVLIEALCLGRPVIATDCPTGPDEIIRHEQNGLLVTVDDVEALSNAMDRLVSDVVLYRYLSANAASSVEDLDIAFIAEQWLKLCKPAPAMSGKP
jgi:glycosyltransferase involved in cell wall biosynthesis